MRAAAALAALMALSACGFQPIYAGGASGITATTLGAIDVAPIPDKGGYLLREELRKRLGEPGGAARYRLEVTLDDRIVGFGIRGDDSISRERRTLRARYRLIDLGTNAVMVDATASSDTAIDVVQSEYAVVAAENTALERLSVDVADQITLRLALFGRTPAPEPAQP